MNFVAASLLVVLMLLGAPCFVWAASVGEIMSDGHGSLTARSAGGKTRSLERGAYMSAQEVLETDSQFAVLRLDDRTLITLRPNTVFSVEEFSYGHRTSYVQLRLSAGGVRVVTGEIAALNPERFLLLTPVGSIQPHGTEFEVRLCGDDCEKEAKRMDSAPSAMRSSVAARVVFLRGRAMAQMPKGEARTLTLGSSLFAEDELRTARRTVVSVAFREGHRVNLQANASMTVGHSGDSGGQHAKEQRLRLHKGAMRLLAGLKGKHLSVTTASLSLKVESGGVDLACNGSCASETDRGSWVVPHDRAVAFARGVLDLLIPPASARVTENGLLVRPWGGGNVVVSGQERTFERIGSERVVLYASPSAEPIELHFIPESLMFPDVPRPDMDESFDPRMRGQELFGGIRQASPEEGVYVRVVAGDVTFLDNTGRRVDLGPNESAFSPLNAPGVVRLEEMPRMMETPAPQKLMRATNPGGKGTSPASAPAIAGTSASPAGSVSSTLRAASPLVPAAAAIIGGAIICGASDCAQLNDGSRARETLRPISP